MNFENKVLKTDNYYLLEVPKLWLMVIFLASHVSF